MNKQQDEKPYSRVETFVFEFTDKQVWKEFFEKYWIYKTEGMRALSCSTGNKTDLAEDALSLLQDLDENGNLNHKQQDLLEEMFKR